MSNNPIYITKPILPKRSDFEKMVDEIWERGYLTNNGPLVKELEKKLTSFFNVKNVILVSNGTVALQLAIKALQLKGEVITTPFSFVATTSSLVWENCRPLFVDIDPYNFNIDPLRIEDKITNKTTAILSTHVFGFPCNVKKIEEIANKYGLKVIYDAAHCFGVEYKNRSLVSYGDISTISFHATKLFHTIEGGAIITNDNNMAQTIRQMRNFGYSENKTDNITCLGINAKLSEFHAAMGLSLLPMVDEIIKKRKGIFLNYTKYLQDSSLIIPNIALKTKYNYHYYPIIFNNENQLLQSKEALEEHNIYPRRYFYPPLNELIYLDSQEATIASDISRKILCLPLYIGLSEFEIRKISNIIINSFNEN